MFVSNKLFLKVLRFSALLLPDYFKYKILDFVYKNKSINNVAIEVSIYNGSRMLLYPRDWVQSYIFIFNYYEKKESAFIASVLRENDTFIDIGANVGYYTLLASKIITKGEIYSFEPELENYQRLNKNIELNNLKNVTAVRKACTDKNGMISFSVAGDDNKGMSSIFMLEGFLSHTQEAETVTLDQFVIDNSITKIDLIKMDIEGAELIALKGMANVLQKLKPAMLIEILKENLIGAGSTVDDFCMYLKNINYKSYRIGADKQLIPIHDYEEGDLIYFRYED
jgi:FkbM family methyltransferase